MNVTGKLYDWGTPFNNVPAKTVNEAWEKRYGYGVDIALIYKDGEFSGVAEPLGAYTLDQTVAKYKTLFEEQEAQEAAAAAKALEPSAEERIAAAMEFQNLMNY